MRLYVSRICPHHPLICGKYLYFRYLNTIGNALASTLKMLASETFNYWRNATKIGHPQWRPQTLGHIVASCRILSTWPWRIRQRLQRRISKTVCVTCSRPLTPAQVVDGVILSQESVTDDPKGTRRGRNVHSGKG